MLSCTIEERISSKILLSYLLNASTGSLLFGIVFAQASMSVWCLPVSQIGHIPLSGNSLTKSMPSKSLLRCEAHKTHGHHGSKFVSIHPALRGGKFDEDASDDVEFVKFGSSAKSERGKDVTVMMNVALISWQCDQTEPVCCL
jgi:hypothetical protein